MTPEHIIQFRHNLSRFVATSNAIEGIYGTGHRLYKDHLRAATAVTEDPQWAARNPAVLHALIMSSHPEMRPGFPRQVRVTVGGRECPPPVAARSRFRKLFEILPSTDGWYETNAMTEEGAWSLHYEFEVIHPFTDGNGRTGRLWLAALQLSAGLPVQIIASDEENRQKYYEAINLYERTGEVTIPVEGVYP